MLAPEAVWCVGVAGSGGVWETSGFQTPTGTGTVRLADGFRGLGRNSPPCERSTGVDAGDDGPRSLALPYE